MAGKKFSFLLISKNLIQIITALFKICSYLFKGMKRSSRHGEMEDLKFDKKYITQSNNNIRKVQESQI